MAWPRKPLPDAYPHCLIIPTLCVGMPQWTLCVRFGTQSVPGCIPTQSVGTIHPQKNRIAAVFLCLQNAA
ncbi:hypothetical protein EJA71_19465 [Pseudomonas sp. PB106]|nr:hypothetical protein EJA71_19465 [Pseudomonas sp. PB106]